MSVFRLGLGWSPNSEVECVPGFCVGLGSIPSTVMKSPEAKLCLVLEKSHTSHAILAEETSRGDLGMKEPELHHQPHDICKPSCLQAALCTWDSWVYDPSGYKKSLSGKGPRAVFKTLPWLCWNF